MNVEKKRKKLNDKLELKKIKLEIENTERAMKLAENKSKIELALANEQLPVSPMKRRLLPFLDLLDARYMPLAVAALPQAHAVYTWMLNSYKVQSLDSQLISIVGGSAFEMVYIGAIAWSSNVVKTKTSNRWYALTAISALLFSMVIAGYTFFDFNGVWALLHVGLPLIAFCYTMYIHNSIGQKEEVKAQEPAKEDDFIEPVYVTQVTSEMNEMRNMLIELLDRPATNILAQPIQTSSIEEAKTSYKEGRISEEEAIALGVSPQSLGGLKKARNAKIGVA